MKLLGLPLAFSVAPFSCFAMISCFALGANIDSATNQNIPLSNIHEITIEALQNKFNNGDIHAIKLHLVQQSAEELHINAPDNLAKKIQVQNAKGQLSIEIAALSQKDANNGIIDIYIATKSANKIQLIGQIDTVLNNYENDNLIEIDVQKGGRLNMTTLKAPNVNLKSAFGSEIQLTNLSSSQLKCSADFGATITITEAAQVNNLEASGSFGGNVSAPQLSANYGKFKASFGSNLRFNKINDTDKSSSFGGEIELSN